MADVKVEQQDGEITIQVDGLSPKTWSVKDHHVTVTDRDLPTFLAAVEGALEIEDNPAKPAADAKDGE